MRNRVDLRLGRGTPAFRQKTRTYSFLPHFSTQGPRTGLGLAIAARIVAEHGGSIHFEDNLPICFCFLVELPVAELTPTSLADHNGSDATR